MVASFLYQINLMKTSSRIFAAVFAILLGNSLSARGQRAIGAESLVLDDGSGNTITIQTPASGWTGNIPFLIPIPPPGSPSSGFTYAGTAAGQVLEWVMPSTTGPAPNNYAGGAQGSWQPITLGAVVGISGAGTAGMIPIWTDASTQGNSALSQNYNNSVAPYSSTGSGEQLLATDAAATEISIALQPKGAGALEAQIADGTAAGGN